MSMGTNKNPPCSPHSPAVCRNAAFVLPHLCVCASCVYMWCESTFSAHKCVICMCESCMRVFETPVTINSLFFFFFWWMSRTSSRFLFILGTAVYRNRTGSEITHRRLLVVELRVCVCVCVRVTTANVTAWTQLAKFTTRAAKLFFCPRAKKKKRYLAIKRLQSKQTCWLQHKHVVLKFGR